MRVTVVVVVGVALAVALAAPSCAAAPSAHATPAAKHTATKVQPPRPPATPGHGNASHTPSRYVTLSLSIQARNASSNASNATTPPATTAPVRSGTKARYITGSRTLADYDTQSHTVNKAGTLSRSLLPAKAGTLSQSLQDGTSSPSVSLAANASSPPRRGANVTATPFATSNETAGSAPTGGSPTDTSDSTDHKSRLTWAIVSLSVGGAIVLAVGALLTVRARRWRSSKSPSPTKQLPTDEPSEVSRTEDQDLDTFKVVTGVVISAEVVA